MKNIRFKICLIDLCLIIFMAVLIFQSVYILFFSSAGSNDTAEIDIIVRTSQAAIYGYFLSGSFGKCSVKNMQLPSGGKATHKYGSIQIVVVSAVGIISLFILIFIRDFTHGGENISAFISQMRDFLTSSVGFLVGSGNSSDKK